ncbi:hypothetical protein ACJ73_09056 [Blastomyces percursus]|uniref:Zn(2)-C6 fungal-type domain-containing protein n=1 Tax=Blastomyces percursus TaxID=1658174 RepID=A0A1J9PFA0_9EURO|nr:hypothetical protein ACJ73_09056 [Blastomyces percursus]
MTAHQPSPPVEASSPSEGNVRKRVCKACDRCRLKKSKCDGANPCGRCKTDNAICVFGERKKAHDKVYPKGYVEMLEQQQAQLVAGLQSLYKMILDGKEWPGDPLKESGNGHPLTHDILERLGALKQEGNSGDEPFEDDLQLAQKKLIANGAGIMQRQDSTSGSESEHSPIFPSRPSVFETPFSMNPNQLPPTPPSPRTFPPRVHQISDQIMEGMSQHQQHQQFILQHQRQQQQQHNKDNLQQRQQAMQHQRQQRQQRQQAGIHRQQQKHLQQSTMTPQRLSQVQATQTQMQVLLSAPGAPPSMNPSLLQRQQSWSQGGGLDDNMDISLDSPLMSFDTPQQTQAFSRPISLTGGLNSCLPIQPDWMEDADFKAFLNPSATMI